QAFEVLKLLLGIGQPLVGRMLMFDGLGGSFNEVELARNPACPVCGDHPSITTLKEYELACDIHGNESYR
ncbi:MAG: adenylyltransferase, partial [Mycobacterium leprae]